MVNFSPITSEQGGQVLDYQKQTHTSVVMLPRDIRRILTVGLWTIDMAAAQLAIIAKAWGLPKLMEALRAQMRDRNNKELSIWNIWCRFLGVDPAAPNAIMPTKTNKEILKHLVVYPLVYGGRLRPGRFVRYDSNGDKILSVSESLDKYFGEGAGDKMLNEEPIMAEIVAGRERMLAQIRRDKGIKDCYGNHIDIPTEPDDEGNRIDNPRSTLAQLSHSYEQQLIHVIFRHPITQIDRGKTPDYEIRLYQFDGLSIWFKRDVRAESIKQRIMFEFDREARRLGIPTYLDPEPEYKL